MEERKPNAETPSAGKEQKPCDEKGGGLVSEETMGGGSRVLTDCQ